MRKVGSRPGRHRGMVIGIAAFVVLAATSVSAVALLSGEQDSLSEVGGVISEVFTGECVTSSVATDQISSRMSAAGYTDWTIDTRAHADECVAAGLNGASSTVVLVPVDHPDVTAAMGQVRQELMDRCMNEEEASGFIGNVLWSVGVKQFEIRTDGPLVFPQGQEDEVRSHVEGGCVVYSGSGRNESGTSVYYISTEVELGQG